MPSPSVSSWPGFAIGRAVVHAIEHAVTVGVGSATERQEAQHAADIVTDIEVVGI